MDNERSKYLLGSQHMHAVMVAIAASESGEFSTPQILYRTGISPASLHTLLGRLRHAGMIECVGNVPGEKTLIYRMVDDPFWDGIRSYARAIADARSSDTEGH